MACGACAHATHQAMGLHAPGLQSLRWGAVRAGGEHAPWLRPPPRSPRQRAERLRGGGGSEEWLPPAFTRLPLVTRWLIAAQSVLFLFGHVVPSHPVLGAGGGQISALGLHPVRCSTPPSLFAGAGRAPGADLGKGRHLPAALLTAGAAAGPR